MAFKQHLGSRGSKPDRIFWSRKGNFLALVALKVTSEMSDQLSRCNRAGKAGCEGSCPRPALPEQCLLCLIQRRAQT